MYLLQNQSHCTRTGFQTLEHIGKPLFLKELPKLWKNENRKFSLKVVDYDKSNTLLLDDSPYKALLNPVSSHNIHTLVLLPRMPSSSTLFIFLNLVCFETGWLLKSSYSLWFLLFSHTPQSFPLHTNTRIRMMMD